LAYYSAFNSQKPFGTGRSDKWHYDIRIPQSQQAGNEFYESNPWDRGHLAAREMVEWGPDGDQADKDSFVWTNISPQHENMHTQRGNEWSKMENHLQSIMEDSALDKKMSIFAGCVFRADDITIKAKGKEDYLQIPQQFWNVSIWVDKNTNALRSKGYLVTNYTFKADGNINDNPSSSFNAALTTSIAEIERLTGFRFADIVHQANV
jgi:endonuclease G